MTYPSDTYTQDQSIAIEHDFESSRYNNTRSKVTVHSKHSKPSKHPSKAGNKQRKRKSNTKETLDGVIISVYSFHPILDKQSNHSQFLWLSLLDLRR